MYDIAIWHLYISQCVHHTKWSNHLSLCKVIALFYIYVCICMYICTYSCIYIFTHTHTHIWSFLCMVLILILFFLYPSQCNLISVASLPSLVLHGFLYKVSPTKSQLLKMSDLLGFFMSKYSTKFITNTGLIFFSSGAVNSGAF